MLKRLLLVLVLVFGVLVSACNAGDVASMATPSKSFIIKNVKLSDVTPSSESDMWAPKKAYKLINLMSDADLGSKYFSTVGEYYQYSYIMADGYLTDWSMMGSGDGLYSIVVAGVKESNMIIYTMSFVVALKQVGNDIEADVISYAFSRDFTDMSDEEMVNALKMSGFYTSKSEQKEATTKEAAMVKSVVSEVVEEPIPTRDTVGYSYDFNITSKEGFQIDSLDYYDFVDNYSTSVSPNGEVAYTKAHKELGKLAKKLGMEIVVHESGKTLSDVYELLIQRGVKEKTYLIPNEFNPEAASLDIVTNNNVTIVINFDCYSLGASLGTEFKFTSMRVYNIVGTDVTDEFVKDLIK